MERPEQRFFINFNSQNPDNHSFQANSPLPQKSDSDYLPILRWRADIVDNSHETWNEIPEVIIGKATFLKPLYIQFYVCHHAVMLIQHLFEGKPFDRVVVRGFDESNLPYMNVYLSNAYIIFSKVEGTEAGHPIITIGMAFDK